MPALERVVGLVVIEFDWIEDGDFAFSSLVLGMARLAGGGFNPAVKARVVADVVRDFLVAVKTLLAERFLVERHVAFFAFGFVFGVIRDQLAGHHHAFDRLSVCPERTQGDKDQQAADPDCERDAHQYICTAYPLG